MSSRNNPVPDAWDDDWESMADKQPAAPPEPEPARKISKAERRVQHAQFNKQLWEQAETPAETPLFLQAQGQVPLANDIKPAVKLLTRKPPPSVLARDDGDDSEEETRKKTERDFAERQAKAAREREEKQRKYAEVRERLFGSPVPAPESSQERSSSPRNAQGNRNSRGKGRGRAPDGPDQAPTRSPKPKRQLFDPNHSAKPNSGASRSRSATPGAEQHVRAPKGPDGSGRGGFGFAPRGGRGGIAS
ncbi:uncharacterized protein K452DRAFT_220860 [Aplosporella prunicola CBS 121167]|uniref:Uncharacterized protein n=1 Tax=Aplosporella prunicola CBS 121167 TaxID=1176127 RepID=A0A6A6BMK7_9PEZI|nr:uncharacterized protein K452DRAFT_220860 [Aplosporella prunicola CBS 121167]KAF2145362.1 hypothetical protein K452DRAFT_220860 [Aplosporella prunicola CBS 121167]